MKAITVPGNLVIACDQFNTGQFFECHETLEEVWQEEQGDLRDLYKGLIQLAAAFVHVTRENYRGADRLLHTSRLYLEPYRPDGALGFAVDRICRQAEAAHAELIARGPARVDEIYPEFVPFLEVDLEALPAEARHWSAWGFDRDGRALEMQVPIVD